MAWNWILILPFRSMANEAHLEKKWSNYFLYCPFFPSIFCLWLQRRNTTKKFLFWFRTSWYFSRRGRIFNNLIFQARTVVSLREATNKHRIITINCGDLSARKQMPWFRDIWLIKTKKDRPKFAVKFGWKWESIVFVLLLLLCEYLLLAFRLATSEAGVVN